MKKAILIVLSIVTCLICIGALGLMLFLRSLPGDIVPVDDSALRRTVETLPDDANAFTEYSAAVEALYHPEDRDKFNRILDEEEWDD